MHQGHCNQGTVDRCLVRPTQPQNRAREEAAVRRRGNRSLIQVHIATARIEQRAAQTRSKMPGHPATDPAPLTEGCL
jgi:hypothetical protein